MPLLYARSADDLVFRGNKVNRNSHYTGWGQPAFNVQACDRAVLELAP